MTFIESFFEDFFINMITALMMSVELTSPGLLKLKGFRKKSYDIIILDYNVINKILPCDSNYIVDVVM